MLRCLAPLGQDLLTAATTLGLLSAWEGKADYYDPPSAIRLPPNSLDNPGADSIYCRRSCLSHPCHGHAPGRKNGAAASVLLWLGDCLCRAHPEPDHVWGG